MFVFVTVPVLLCSVTVPVFYNAAGCVLVVEGN